jgi:hypothetical protein
MEGMSGKMQIYIPIDKLINNHIYEVKGRNFSAAVWKAKNRRFYGVRHKWGDTYISSEVHWDEDSHFGTVKPLREIRELEFSYCPSCGQADDNKLIEILNPIDEECYKRQNEEFRKSCEELYGPIQES